MVDHRLRAIQILKDAYGMQVAFRVGKLEAIVISSKG